MRILFLIGIAFTLYACNSDKQQRPDTALDTGREFIRASLNGNFKDARALIFSDAENNQLFESYTDFYNKLPAGKKENYKNASYEINKYLDLDDSTTIINYSNSYMNKPMEIKIIRKDNNWWVDFKYTYSGNLPID